MINALSSLGKGEIATQADRFWEQLNGRRRRLVSREESLLKRTHFLASFNHSLNCEDSKGNRKKLHQRNFRKVEN